MNARDVLYCLGCLGAVVAVLIISLYTQGRSGNFTPTHPTGPSRPGGTSSGYTPPAKQRCSCNRGKVPCNCSGGYVTDHNGQLQRHYQCGGSGELTCQMCNGTGLR